MFFYGLTIPSIGHVQSYSVCIIISLENQEKLCLTSPNPEPQRNHQHLCFHLPAGETEPRGNENTFCELPEDLCFDL